MQEYLEQLKDELIRKEKEREEAIRLRALEEEKIKETIQVIYIFTLLLLYARSAMLHRNANSPQAHR